MRLRLLVKTAKQLTHLENSVETTTSIDHDETDVEEHKKVECTELVKSGDVNPN